MTLKKFAEEKGISLELVNQVAHFVKEAIMPKIPLKWIEEGSNDLEIGYDAAHAEMLDKFNELVK